MNAITRITAIALTLAAGTAFAQEATYDMPQPVASAVSRSAVQADLAAAKSHASLRGLNGLHNAAKAATSERTRAEVRSETLAAIASGEIQALTADSNAFVLHATPYTPRIAARQLAQAKR